MSLSRRNLLKIIPATAVVSMVPRVSAAAPHHVVVVGGGFAGCTVAKYLRMWSGGAIDVTLIEPNARHVSCVMSNLVLNEQLQLADLSFDYQALQQKHGVVVERDKVLTIRTLSDGQRQVKLKAARWKNYDSIVFAAGIKFKNIRGVDHSVMPHAWIAGPQTNLLRDQIQAMGANDDFVMTIPKAPYRCPPGPYERACLVADILKQRGGSNKVTVLDANPEIQAEKTTFRRAFDGLYNGIIEYVPNADVKKVESGSGTHTVFTKDGRSFSGQVLNVIPPHKANQVLAKCGLTNSAGWAPVDPVDYSSTVPGDHNAYVIGDAQATGQPKSGHMANSQAKVCADAIIRTAKGLSTHTDERLDNITTNSACFSPITASEASWLTAVWRYNSDGDLGRGSMDLVPGSLGEAHGWNSENYRDMFAWSENLFADTFM